MATQQDALPPQFLAKKQAILSHLALDPRDYEDKSPKGSVDVQILDLIRLINGVDGWVTTSSCAGRVAVFVEGPKKTRSGQDLATATKDAHGGSDVVAGAAGTTEEDFFEGAGGQPGEVQVKTAPGGKGGGHWLYVSHDPLPAPPNATDSSQEHWTTAFNLSRPLNISVGKSTNPPRLVHLSYSPLILHVLCASLQHARPLLSAAINAGFRESGVQSLRALEPASIGDGVMVAIRTNGIIFESIVGLWDEVQEEAVAIVDEAYLQMCASVVNERFSWNEDRKERLMGELHMAMKREGWSGDAVRAETKEERRERKRREGLERQQASKVRTSVEHADSTDELDLGSLEVG